MVRPGGPAEHLAKAAEFFASVAVLQRAGLAARAVSDAYYAAFHVAQALLATAGLGAETRAGVHTLLARHFVKDGPLPASLSRDLTHLMADRLLADYGVEREMTEATARDAVASGARIAAAMLDALADREPALGQAIGPVRAGLAEIAAPPPP